MPAVHRLRPTPRGYGVALVAVAAAVLAVVGGTRALGAVVGPALAALAVGALQLSRAAPPTISRSAIDPGAPGEERIVEATVDAGTPCTVVEAVGEGLSVPGGSGGIVREVGHGGAFEYAIELTGRGEWRLGPARCRITDSLGLFRTEVEDATDGTTTALVYPQIYDLDPGALSGVRRRLRGDDRDSFERVREFTPGDSMRDIHWLASATRPDGEFVVAEYGGGRRAGSAVTTVAGESTPAAADAMASAVASVAAALVAGADTPIAVAVPEGRRTVRRGALDPALRLLAVTEGGRLGETDRRAADVVVSADGGGVRVSTGDEAFEFGRLRDGPTGTEPGIGVSAR